MSPIQRHQALGCLVDTFRAHKAVCDVNMKYDPRFELGTGNEEVLRLDILRLNLYIQESSIDGARASIAKLFWDKAFNLGIPLNSILLELDGDVRPYFDPPL